MGFGWKFVGGPLFPPPKSRVVLHLCTLFFLWYEVPRQLTWRSTVGITNGSTIPCVIVPDRDDQRGCSMSEDSEPLLISSAPGQKKDPTATRVRSVRNPPWLWRVLAIGFWGIIAASLMIPSGAISPVPRSAVIICYLILALWTVGTLRTILTMFYPFVLFVNDLPSLFGRNWAGFLFRMAKKHWVPVLLLGVPVAVKATSPVKRQVTALAIGLVAMILIVSDCGLAEAVVSMIALLALLVRHYWRQFRTAFVPVRLLVKITEFIETDWRMKRDAILLSEDKKVPPENPEFAKRRHATLEVLLIADAVIIHVLSRLKRFQQSQLLTIFAILGLLWTFLMSVVVFGLEFYGLSRLGNNHFSGEGGSSFYFYLYFSFTNFLTANSGTFGPASGWARALSALELLCMLLVGIFFVLIFTTIVREQQRDQLDRLIAQLGQEHAAIVALIDREYSLSVQEALRRIEDDKPSSVVVTIYKAMPPSP